MDSERQLINRRWMRTLARGLVASFLLTQVAIAAYACPAAASASSDPAVSAAAMLTVQDATDDSPTMTRAGASHCDPAATVKDPQSPNLCAEHCKVGMQSSQVATPTAPDVCLYVLYPVPALPDPAALSITAPAASPMTLAASRPPHAILHCVFRI
ncbi:MAG: hypothetical protein H7125_04560 [Proteobacteria bacterium]|nr:hypothetical protein [Burkholderiales bacterium]